MEAGARQVLLLFAENGLRQTESQWKRSARANWAARAPILQAQPIIRATAIYLTVSIVSVSPFSLPVTVTSMPALATILS